MPTKTGVRTTKAQRTQSSLSAAESARRVLVSYADDAVAVGNSDVDELSGPEPASETSVDDRAAAMTARQVKADVDQALAAYEQAAIATKAVYTQSVEEMKASVAEFKAEVKDEIEKLQAAVGTMMQSFAEDIKSLNAKALEEIQAANAEFMIEIKAEIARHHAAVIECVRTEIRGREVPSSQPNTQPQLEPDPTSTACKPLHAARASSAAGAVRRARAPPVRAACTHLSRLPGLPEQPKLPTLLKANTTNLGLPTAAAAAAATLPARLRAAKSSQASCPMKVAVHFIILISSLHSTMIL
ncbi:hypothetical protein PHYSODRAFT_304971 [Phytophthora sojae]|uniref:Uncharacterized protein n=1 Tax=Phytophthora sojae (strain P6497) TaxID=1094619 RepID=G5A3T7_PHYSP|nr:hypothetical protein PHYSODRAFT_304971 [Phytophthora sojae]EGZ09437.1 hypothetical protein PHYSODRAFT_304971 [Phytophthora sojae]|eukprot:XP_009534298.1 hypothetical protein PHYSODRAFT_304971 [Phytophthora sojae]